MIHTPRDVSLLVWKHVTSSLPYFRQALHQGELLLLQISAVLCAVYKGPVKTSFCVSMLSGAVHMCSSFKVAICTNMCKLGGPILKY